MAMRLDSPEDRTGNRREPKTALRDGPRRRGLCATTALFALLAGAPALAQETESSSEPIMTATQQAAPPAADAPVNYIVPDLAPSRGAPRPWPSAGFTLKP
ncbi:MAG: hypothetical protein ACKN9P_04730, partial [Phenylobacterium sp.]